MDLAKLGDFYINPKKVAFLCRGGGGGTLKTSTLVFFSGNEDDCIEIRDTPIEEVVKTLRYYNMDPFGL